MPWPLEREGVRQFAEGLDEVLVVEEKRAIIENQLKEQLYNWREDVRPRVIGKFDENRNWVLPSPGELTPARIARVIAARIAPFYQSERIERRLDFLTNKEASLERSTLSVQRTPHYCSGCPHNTSTKVPEGSRALAGIGCHYMATWMNRRTETFTQMGGEGATWIGQSPFTETRHVFANLGDGTFYHSGLLAIRAAVASGANITYKLLVNDAVAMTGGQPVEGSMSVPAIARELAAEGVKRIAIVCEDPKHYDDVEDLPKGVEVYHRDRLPGLQLEFRELQGTTVIIYEQVCAAEKRRRRKRGLMEDPPKRVIINPDVCEGCGDCGVQSNCLAVVPLETELGRKRTIDQSACNKDFSCLKGFCPSFVVVHDAKLKKPEKQTMTQPREVLPEPVLPSLEKPYRIVITGVGGTGVVTISALLGMAAHVDGRGATVLDMTGLAQKYGAVTSHVQVSSRVGEVKAVRVAAGGANLLLGCDSVVAASFDALSKVESGHTRVVVNNHRSATAQFINQPDLAFPDQEIRGVLGDAAGDDACDFFDATTIAEKLLGDSIGANLLVVGFAWQKGLVPIRLEALHGTCH
jgi:indolepyruvate ferredoxin oxidoreductase